MAEKHRPALFYKEADRLDLIRPDGCPRCAHALPEEIERYELNPGRVFAPFCGWELEPEDGEEENKKTAGASNPGFSPPRLVAMGGLEPPTPRL